jgi:cysteine protease ATG4
MTIDLNAISALLVGAKVLVWIPMRLGVDSLNSVYVNPIKELLTNRCTVGVAGYDFEFDLIVRGKPNSALYFIGFDQDELLYLDPHYTRPAVQQLNKEVRQGSYFCHFSGVGYF